MSIPRTSPDVTDAQLRLWYTQWSEEGRSKNEIERNEISDPFSHGKTISRLWRNRLGIETEAEHPLVTENKRLRKLLDENGITD